MLLLVALFATFAPAPAAAQGFQRAAATGTPPGWREENLLQNGDFSETDEHGGPAFWEAVGARGLWRADGGQDGTAGVGLVRDDRGEGVWRQAVEGDLEPGARYVVSAWVRGEPGAVAFVGVEGLAGEASTGVQRIFRGLASDEWQPLSLEFTAPASGAVRVWLGADFEGSVWWDGAFLGRAEELPERLARIWEDRLSRYKRVYTGLVVDARGLGIERGMSPRIEDTEGNLLYSGMGADFEWVIRRGIVSYMKDLHEALVHSRLAAHELYPYRLPMIVRAVGRVDDGFNASVIVRAHDADVIRRQLLRYDFLARFAVVFLID